MSYLQPILDQKRRDVETQLRPISDQLMAESMDVPYANSRERFVSAISVPGKLQLIAEIKQASPSRGIIRSEFDPKELALSFSRGGAAALSVLTERHYFNGDPDHIYQVKSVSELPILRKDFILDPLQIYESKRIGADAILLIKSLLTTSECQSFIDLAHELDLATVVEIHDHADLNSALTLVDVDVIGINNRNLNTFDVDLQTGYQLFLHLLNFRPKSTVIAESGYRDIWDLDTLRHSGINGVLIGEGLAVNPKLMEYFITLSPADES